MSDYILRYKNPYNVLFNLFLPKSVLKNINMRRSTLTALHLLVSVFYIGIGYSVLYIFDSILEVELLDPVLSYFMQEVIPFVFSPIGVGVMFLTVYSIYITRFLYSNKNDIHRQNLYTGRLLFTLSLAGGSLLFSISTNALWTWIITFALLGIIPYYVRRAIKIDLSGNSGRWSIPQSESQYYPGELFLIAVNGVYYSGFAVLFADMSIGLAKYIFGASIVMSILYLFVRSQVYRSGNTDISPKRYYKFKITDVDADTEYTCGSWYFSGLFKDSISENKNLKAIVNDRAAQNRSQSSQSDSQSKSQSDSQSSSQTWNPTTTKQPKYGMSEEYKDTMEQTDTVTVEEDEQRTEQSSDTSVTETVANQEVQDWYGNTVKITTDSTLMDVTDEYKKYRSEIGGEAFSDEAKLTADQLLIEKLVLLNKYSQYSTPEENLILKLVDEINSILSDIEEDHDKLFTVDIDSITVE